MNNKIVLSSFFVATAWLRCQAFDFNEAARSLAMESYAVKSLNLESKAGIAELESENSLSPMDAEFGYLWGEGLTQNKWNISISQSFDWPGVYVARRKGIAAASRAYAAAERSAVMSQTLEIKQAMIDIVAAKKYLELSSTLNDSISRLYITAKTGVDKGEITRLDLNKIEIERIGIRKQLAADKRNYYSAVEALERLCATDVSGIIAALEDYPDDVLLPSDTYELLLTENNPAIFEARQNVLSAKAMESVEKRLLLPGVSIGYTYENEGEDKWHGLTAGISLPIFSSRKKEKAARIRAQLAQSEAVFAANQESAALKAQRARAVSLFEEMQQYRPIFESTDNIALLRKAVAGGQMSLYEYFGELNYFIAARRDYLEVQYEYHTALARLNRLTLLPVFKD